MMIASGRYYRVVDPDSMFFQMLLYSHSITVEYHEFSDIPNPLVLIQGSLAVVDDPVVFSSMHLQPVTENLSLFKQLKINFDVLCKYRDEAINRAQSAVTVTASKSAVTVIDPEEVF